MIITVQGYEGKKNFSLPAATVMAAETALKLGKKILVIQPMNNTNNTVDNLLIGKAMKAKELKVSGISLSNIETGIDALLRAQQGQTLDKEDFSTACRSLASTKNTFDVLGVSLKQEFEYDLLHNFEPFTRMLEEANHIYNVVYIVMPAIDKELNEKITALADTNIICLKQGDKNIPIFDKKSYPLITDYESRSLYNIAWYKKHLNTNKVFTFPHNVEFRDASVNENVLTFLSKNMENEKSDENYFLIHSTVTMLESLIGSSDKNDEIIVADAIAEEEEEKDAYTKDFLGVKYEEKTVKKGFFGRKYTAVVPVTSDEENVEESEPIVNSENPPTETMPVEEENSEEIVGNSFATIPEPVEIAEEVENLDNSANLQMETKPVEENEQPQKKPPEKKQNHFGRFFGKKKGKTSVVPEPEEVKENEDFPEIEEEEVKSQASEESIEEPTIKEPEIALDNVDAPDVEITPEYAFERLNKYATEHGLSMQVAVMSLGLTPQDGYEQMVAVINEKEEEERKKNAGTIESLFQMFPQ